MNIEENQNKFLFPRSYVGRAIFYLFSVPFVTIIFHYIYSFICFAIKAVFKYIGYCNGTIERPRELVYDSFFAEFLQNARSYLRHFVISQMENIYVYFDVVFTIGVFAFLVWICLRYTRNGAFGKIEWFKTFVYSNCLWLAILVTSTIFAYLDGFYENFSHLLTDQIASLVYQSVKCAVSCYIAYVIFLKIPFGDNPVWKNEYKSKEFFSHNIKLFFKKMADKMKSNNYFVRVVLLLCVLFAIDIIYWVFKTI